MKGYTAVPVYYYTHLPQANTSVHLEKIPSDVWNHTETAESLAVHQLLPTLAECFIVILCGYICGRLQYITSTEIKGLTIFTSYFTLPSLIFLNLATIDLTDVHWLFILGIVLGKSLIFALVAIATTLFHQPFNLALVGLYGILCTQGSDFSLAYPVVRAVFGHTQSSYPGYMYIIAPLSHVLLNPIGFLFMETEHARAIHADTINHRSRRQRYGQIILSVVQGVAKNPCVMMTLVGIAANLLSRRHLPFVIEHTLKTLSSAFSASILFLLGFTIYGSSTNVKSFNLSSVLLILVKMFIAPFILYIAVSVTCRHFNDKETLSQYAFLYGTVPSGPIVLLFAAQHGLPTEMLASTLVLNTFLSAPLIFIAVKLIEFSEKDLISASISIETCILYVSLLSFFAATWVVAASLARGTWKRIPHFMVFGVAICQICIGIGALLWKFQMVGKWNYTLQLILLTGGMLSGRILTAFFAIALMLLKKHRLASISSWNLLIVTAVFGFGIPLVVVTSLAAAGQESQEIKPPPFTSDKSQLVTILLITALSLVVTVSGVLGYFSHSIPTLPFWCDKDGSSKPDCVHSQSSSFGLKLRSQQPEKIDLTESSTKVSHHLQKTAIINVLPVFLALEWKNIGLKKINFIHNGNAEKLYRRKISAEGHYQEGEDQAELGHRHLILIVFQIVAMVTNIFSCGWKLIGSNESGIYLFLQYLDALQNYSQGIIILFLFNINIKPLVKTWISRCRPNVSPSAKTQDEVLTTRF